MKRKTALALLLATAMIVGLVAGCSGGGSAATAAPSATPEATPTPTAKPYKVLYLVNGNLGDKGFYDSAASGIYRLRDELGMEVKIVEMGRDETSYEGYYLDASEQDWDLIVSGTWSVKELAQNIAAQYPDKNYLFFDGEVDYTVVKDHNMMGISYKSNETGYMAGCLAALMLDSGAEKIDPAKRILGFVGSMDTPNINDFLVGYIEGIKYVDPSIKLLTSYVGSFEDVPKCLEMTTQLYNQGAQVVYAPTSQSMLGAVTASSNEDKYLIACDTDIWAQMVDSDANAVRNVLSSSLKNVGDSIFTSVSGLIDGSKNCGENYVLGLSSGAVGLADNDNFEKLVPEKVRTQLTEIAKKVSDGEITVGTAFGMDTAAVAALRDGMKP